MKKTLLLYFTLIPFFLSAQVKGEAVIEWLGVKEMSYGKFKVNIPRFSGPSFHYDAAKRAVFYTAKVKDVPYSDENKIQITNVVYDAITLSELGDLASENIPKTTNSTMIVSTSRGTREAFVTISPIIKDDFGFKRVKSFSYEVEKNNSRISLLNKTTNSISNSVLANGNWFRFYIEKSGVYKLSKSFLQQLGLDVNTIDPKKIKIYGNGGRMLPLANNLYYPNDLTENAIQINGESDGVFNNEDFILF
ncbi:MAG TPA: peptidase C25, partial [Flavobacterium sp.]|nr:peptidase C25 [Flavobacterium sp.]HRL72598.1 peptidase C25 [Flavobacterium sp.]